MCHPRSEANMEPDLARSEANIPLKEEQVSKYFVKRQGEGLTQVSSRIGL